MKVKSESEVNQLCPTFRDPVDCSLPRSSVYGIFQARVLEWGAIAFSIQFPRPQEFNYPVCGGGKGTPLTYILQPAEVNSSAFFLLFHCSYIYVIYNHPEF